MAENLLMNSYMHSLNNGVATWFRMSEPPTFAEPESFGEWKYDSGALNSSNKGQEILSKTTCHGQANCPESSMDWTSLESSKETVCCRFWTTTTVVLHLWVSSPCCWWRRHRWIHRARGRWSRTRAPATAINETSSSTKKEETQPREWSSEKKTKITWWQNLVSPSSARKPWGTTKRTPKEWKSPIRRERE